MCIRCATKKPQLIPALSDSGNAEELETTAEHMLIFACAFVYALHIFLFFVAYVNRWVLPLHTHIMANMYSSYMRIYLPDYNRSRGSLDGARCACSWLFYSFRAYNAQAPQTEWMGIGLPGALPFCDAANNCLK